MPVSTTAYEDKQETPTLPKQGNYLSWLDEAHLLELSGITGLRYHRLEDPGRLGQLLRERGFAASRMVDTDMRPFLGLAALALLVAAHWPGSASRARGPRTRRH